MKKAGISFIGIIALLGICFVVLMVYVSLLGENKKIDSVVEKFFENIREQRYFSLEDNRNVVENFDVFDTDGEYSDNCLFLKYALFEKYNISDTSNWRLEIEKNHFWVPFTSNSKVRIAVSLKKPDGSIVSAFLDTVSSFFRKSHQSGFVDNLFTVERISGRWLITTINIRDTSLFESFKKNRGDLNIDNYVSLSGTKVTVKPIEIDTKNISDIERRRLTYLFQKLFQLTESSGIKADEF